MSNKKSNKKGNKAQAPKKKSNKKLLIAVASVVVLIAIVVGVWLITKPKAEEGAKGITVSVLHKNDTVWAMTFYTTLENLGVALEEKGIIRPEDNDNGVVHTVRGEKVEENAEWKLYINAEEATTNVYETILENGMDYRLEYTIKD